MAPIATADQQQLKELAKKNINTLNNKGMTEKPQNGYLFPSKFLNVLNIGSKFFLS